MQAIPFIHNLLFVGVQRISNQVQLWVNGRKAGSLSSALVGPTGGTSAQLNVASGGSTLTACTAYWDRAISDDEMKLLYNKSMGVVFGKVS